jgi:hypothetical protein
VDGYFHESVARDMNGYFYETVVKERLRCVERQAELRRLVASGSEAPTRRHWHWRERLHLGRKPQSAPAGVACKADPAG